jgi:hypothetical protein
MLHLDPKAASESSKVILSRPIKNVNDYYYFIIVKIIIM